MRLDQTKALIHEIQSAEMQTAKKSINGESLFVAKDFLEGLGYSKSSCEVPDDCIDRKRRALFVSRDVMRGLIDELRSELT